MAWGIWRRKHPDGQGLNQINKFFVNHIENEVTQELVNEAVDTYTVPEGETRAEYLPAFPGLTFSIKTEQGAAMLGELIPQSKARRD